MGNLFTYNYKIDQLSDEMQAFHNKYCTYNANGPEITAKNGKTYYLSFTYTTQDSLDNHRSVATVSQDTSHYNWELAMVDPSNESINNVLPFNDENSPYLNITPKIYYYDAPYDKHKAAYFDLAPSSTNPNDYKYVELSKAQTSGDKTLTYYVTRKLTPYMNTFTKNDKEYVHVFILGGLSYALQMSELNKSNSSFTFTNASTNINISGITFDSEYTSTDTLTISYSVPTGYHITTEPYISDGTNTTKLTVSGVQFTPELGKTYTVYGAATKNETPNKLFIYGPKSFNDSYPLNNEDRDYNPTFLVNDQLVNTYDGYSYADNEPITLTVGDSMGEQCSISDLYGTKTPHLWYYTTKYVSNADITAPVFSSLETAKNTVFHPLDGTNNNETYTFSVPDSLLGVTDNNINVFMVNGVSVELDLLKDTVTYSCSFTNDTKNITINGVDFSKTYTGAQILEISYTIADGYTIDETPTIVDETGTETAITQHGISFNINTTANHTYTIKGSATKTETPTTNTQFGSNVIYTPTNSELTELSKQSYILINGDTSTSIDYSKYVVNNFVCYGDISPITSDDETHIYLGQKDTEVSSHTINNNVFSFDFGVLTVPENTTNTRIYLPFDGFENIDANPNDTVHLTYTFSLFSGDGCYNIYINDKLCYVFDAKNNYSIPWKITGSAVSNIDINGKAITNKIPFLQYGSYTHTLTNITNGHIQNIAASKDELDELENLLDKGITE